MRARSLPRPPSSEPAPAPSILGGCPPSGARQSRHGGPSVLFRAAGGPRVGFGHVVRALSLAKAMEVRPRLSVRGTRETARVAHRLGAHVEDEALAGLLRRGDVGLLVIDDPDARAAAAALAIARRVRVPVASLHDLGLAPIASDLAIDGSLSHLWKECRKEWPAAKTLLGPRYAVLEPSLLAVGQSPRSPAEGRQRVLVSLGGGRRVEAGLRLARAIAVAHPDAWVTLAAGFGTRRADTGHPRVRVLESPGWLRCELARMDVAVLAGGVTLYEAAVLGVPVVAVAVVAAQLPTIRAFDRGGAALAAGALLPGEDGALSIARTRSRVVHLVGELLADAEKRRAMAARARQQIDGRGALRVAIALRSLMELESGAPAHGAVVDVDTAAAAVNDRGHDRGDDRQHDRSGSGDWRHV